MEEDKPKHPGGRPLAFKSVEDLQLAVQRYFDLCDPHAETRLVDGGLNQKGQTIWVQREVMTEQKPYTLSGLARSLGVNRVTVKAYGDKEEFSDTIAAARERCEEYAESQLFTQFANGAKFNLTNNYQQWTDKRELTGADGGPLVTALVEFVGDEPAETTDHTD